MTSTRPRSPNAATALLNASSESRRVSKSSGAEPIDERLVRLLEARCLAAADRFHSSRGDPCLLGKRRMREPFVLRTPEPGGRDDRQLRKPSRQGGAPAQMFAQFPRVFADLWRSDQ